MSSDKNVELQIDLVEKVTKQIVTLCSAIIVVLVTVLGYYFEYFTDQSVLSLGTSTILLASFFLLFSIISGLVVYGSLIATLHRNKKLENVNVYGSPITYFAILQWITFGIGIAILIFALYQISLAPISS